MGKALQDHGAGAGGFSKNHKELGLRSTGTGDKFRTNRGNN